jgi:hypothetical protein
VLPTCVPSVQLALPLVACEHCLLCIDHYADVPNVLVGSKNWLVFALQDDAQVGCKPANDLQQQQQQQQQVEAYRHVVLAPCM